MAMTQKTTTKVNICSTAFLGTSCTDILILKNTLRCKCFFGNKTVFEKKTRLPIYRGVVSQVVLCEESQWRRQNVQTKAVSPSWFFLLHVVTLLWGTQHAIIKYCLDYCSPELLNFTRFGLAGFVSLVTLFQSNVDSTDKTVEKHQSESILMVGIELGLWLFLGYALQSVGLQTTNANKSGFLLYLNVKFVPLIAWLFYGRRISRDIWFAAAAALFGTLLLSFDSPRHFQVGDVWCIASAVASAMFILRLDNAAKRYSSTLLNAISLWTVTLFSFGWLVIENIPLVSFGWFYDLGKSIQWVIQQQWLCFLYLGCVTTALCNWLQTIAQRKIPAEKASLIYALDPVYGTLFSWFWLNEELSFQASFGALFIVGAAIYSAGTSAKGSQE
eukprot:jgi/Galph1/1490/GphlegSOOS_G164.1